MANYLVSDTQLTGIADAIRAKSGGSSQLVFPTGFVSEIGDIISVSDLDTYTETETISTTCNFGTINDPTYISTNYTGGVGFVCLVPDSCLVSTTASKLKKLVSVTINSVTGYIVKSGSGTITWKAEPHTVYQNTGRLMFYLYGKLTSGSSMEIRGNGTISATLRYLVPGYQEEEVPPDEEVIGS